MARLNDLPGPTESLEALKRRFVRQNREIARVNSLQSLRIQGLESEITHLLKENAILKEQVISLSQDAQKYEAGRFLCKDIYQYKEKLAAKLSELNSLVDDFGQLPGKFLNNSTTAVTNSGATEIHNTAEMRRSVTRAEDSGRLPTIVEDKYFPRRTLDCEDLADLTTIQDLDSPNIGPPPIAHFDVDQNSGSEPRLSDPDIARYSIPDYTENPERSISHSPETFNDPQEQVFGTTKNAPRIEIPVPPVISGSKRKFSATDEEDNFMSQNVAIDDDFQFTRSVDISREPRPNTTFQVSKESHGVSGASKPQQKRSSLSKRKVLEPKSTNMIASSPRRQQEGGTSEQKNNGKQTILGKQKDDSAVSHSIERRGAALPLKPGQADEEKRSDVHKKTSTTAVIDNLASSKTYAGQSKLRGSSGMDEPAVTDAGLLQSLPSRQSRRARGAVSYAEPNLRDKMRRATNELVDAVVNDRRRTSTSQGDKFGQDDTDTSDSTKTRRKSVPRDDEVSVSSLIQEENPSRIATAFSVSSNGQKLTEIPASMITDRKRRTLSANTSEITHSQEHDSMPELKQKSKNGQAKAHRLSRSSETGSTDQSAYPHRQTTHRHSSSTKAQVNLSQGDNFGDYEQTQNPNPKTSIETRESVLGHAQTLTTADEESGTKTLAATQATQAKRGQRAAARRRSMLLYNERTT